MADTSEQNESAENGQDGLGELWNARYCEVIPVTRDGRTLTSWVYNTIGLNDCPADKWDALTEDLVNEEYGSIAAKLNGPRYWVMDKLVGTGATAAGDPFVFGGIEMAQRAKLDTKLREGTVGEEFYVPNEVQRNTVYTYNAGRTVYELTSREGDIYIMQSYAQIKDKNLTIDDLDTLGERLALPDGWTYKPRPLTEDLVLDSGGLAYVVNDDFYNSYQRRT